MKNLFSLLALLISSTSIMQCPYASADDALTVQVKETKLRSAPHQWANSISSLKYGDSIFPENTSEDWVSGTTKSKQKGFVHISALTSKKIVLASGKSASNIVDPTDVILAGKGFSKATEDEYARQNAGSNFKAVDSVLAMQVPDSDVVSFMKEGQLGGGEK